MEQGTRHPYYWSLYAGLVVARLVLGPFLLQGYVHPDEFFQSGQEIWYGHYIAWEFEPQYALRSVLPPAIATGIPLRIYGWLIKCMGGSREGSFSGEEVLCIPRFACALLSVLAVDWSIWSVIKCAAITSKPAKQESAAQALPLSMLLLASGWPTLVMLSRPFSNAMETFFVALLVAAVLRFPNSNRSSPKQCLYIGMLCALGIFTRFTFVFFAIPVMLLFLYDLGNHGTTMELIQKVALTTVSFFLVSFWTILADTCLYTTNYFQTVDRLTDGINIATTHMALQVQQLVITPWNALAYNSKVSNLQDHGLHPRWTHALVNMFILFGPLTLLGYYKIFVTLIIGRTQQNKNQQYTENAKQQQLHARRTTNLACWMIVSGLGFLSLAPHQEPRFLLPLVVPLVLLAHTSYGTDNSSLTNRPSLKRLGGIVWIVFNVILFLLFGVLHQSGVVPSLLQMGQSMATEQEHPAAILYYHTYMPPSFLLRQVAPDGGGDAACAESDGEESSNGYCSSSTNSGTLFGTLLHDLKGSDWSMLEQSLDSQLACHEQAFSNPTNFVVLVMPTMIRETPNDDDGEHQWFFTPNKCHLPNYQCQVIRSHPNHLSTEDFPPFGGSVQQFYRNMALNVFRVSCSNEANAVTS